MTEEAPTLLLLQTLKLDSEKSLRIIKKVQPYWKKLAIQLGMEDSYKTIENQNKDSEACQEMLSQWINGQGSAPASWKTLIQALKDIELSTLAEKLESFFK